MKQTFFAYFVAILMLSGIYSCKKNDGGFVQTSPANGSNNVGTMQVLACTSVTGAVSYTFSYTDGAGTISKTSPLDTVTIQNLKPCDSYSWSVTATKADGSTVTTQPDWVFATSANAAIPCLSSPNNNSTNICLGPQLTWTAVSGSNSYSLEIATDANFLSSSVYNTSASNYTLPVSALSAGTKYYWHVSAGSTYSATYTFTTVGAPTLSSPDNHSTGTSRTPSFSWSSNSCTSDYMIDVSTSSSFGSTVISRQVSGTSFSVNASSPLPAYATYYWRVRAIGYSATSATWSFSTGL